MLFSFVGEDLAGEQRRASRARIQSAPVKASCCLFLLVAVALMTLLDLQQAVAALRERGLQREASAAQVPAKTFFSAAVWALQRS